MTPFINKSVKINLMGRAVEIKPLTLKQTVCLGSLLGAAYENIIAKTGKDGNFILKIIASSDEAAADNIINILTNFIFEGIKNISSALTLEETALLAKAITEVNDFEGISANFKSAFGKMKI